MATFKQAKFFQLVKVITEILILEHLAAYSAKVVDLSAFDFGNYNLVIIAVIYVNS